jgi:GNAT superfamily N-acetyltransferase
MSVTEECLISTDKTLLDVRMIYNFLSQSYWAAGRPFTIVKKAIENSLCFGIYCNKKQIGFARVVTDYSTFAYLADVFILEEYRGKGYSKKLLKTIVEYPELQSIKRWILATNDAHNLYAKFGFKSLKNPEKFMEIVKNISSVNLKFLDPDENSLKE